MSDELQLPSPMEFNQAPANTITTSDGLLSARKRKGQQSNDTNSSQSKKRRKSKLSGLLELPLDVLDIIVEHLDPKTLISLSRLSRIIRLHLSAGTIWTNCRQRAGLPDLEADDISDRQYIHLVFDTRCHDCGRGNVQKADFLACSRLCADCRRASQLKPHDDLHEYHPQAWLCAKDYTPEYWVLKGTWRNKPRGILKISQKLHTLRHEEVERFVQSRIRLKQQISRDTHKINEWLKADALKRKEENAFVLSS
ncbi:hypothetical protein DL96DRAFT_497463 [Flagelloscypha sp. PMI_526]|nr:hypothetical protein DL96DRAFT_1725375 [Flagelloscypha sp. PMI_526]KAH8834568.1 hypothetical protein DL96DRAFT_497463 [Flagelloscypha sp. PMI_526]